MKPQTKEPKRKNPGKRTANTQAILLCRESSCSNRSLESLKEQRAIGAAYAKQLGLTIIKTYKVPGLRAFDGRFRWSDFLLRLRLGEETHILIRGADRLRKGKDWLPLLAAAHGKKKIIHFIYHRASYDLGAGLNLEGIHGTVCPAEVPGTAMTRARRKQIVCEALEALQ